MRSQEQAHQVAVPRGDLLPHDQVEGIGRPAHEGHRLAGTGDGVVVGDGDDVEACVILGEGKYFFDGACAVAVVRVHVHIGKADGAVDSLAREVNGVQWSYSRCAVELVYMFTLCVCCVLCLVRIRALPHFWARFIRRILSLCRVSFSQTHTMPS